MSISLATRLADLYANLNKRDGKWEVAASNKAVPTSNVPGEVAQLGKDMDDVASTFQTEFPHETDMIERLNSGARELVRLGQRAGDMRTANLYYASAWGETLNDKIVTVRDAMMMAMKQ